MVKSKFLLLIVSIFVLLALQSQPWARQSRLSMAVAVMKTGADVAPFLQHPGRGYVQAYVRFGPDMPDDVLMAVDQEFLDGVSNPLYVSGGDWMALVAVQRSGLVWIAGGSAATLAGHPSTSRNWHIKSLGTRLQPNIWYLLRVEADFGTRYFKSFTISGPGINRTIDLSNYPVDYPNYMPFDSRMMTYDVGTMRSADMATRTGTPVAYFDDVSGGRFWSNGSDHRLFSNGFETQSTVTAQPVNSVPMKTSSYVQGRWYLERAESLVTIQKGSFAHSGPSIGVANARLN